ncbi:hypothetical protein SH661x_003731 [Planctomicrobium sp. SH661]|uniref:hypothetical protein n=1 Tax=Planctomicrobium sp. SH661 TaxID=3448124 RepID=UPI003F5B3A7E
MIAFSESPCPPAFAGCSVMSRGNDRFTFDNVPTLPASVRDKFTTFHGGSIDKAEFDALPEQDQQQIYAVLESEHRAFFLQPASKNAPARYVTASADYLGNPEVAIFFQDRNTQDFVIPHDDHRVRHCAEIGFRVHNAKNRTEAKRMLRDFLQDMLRIGFHVY